MKSFDRCFCAESSAYWYNLPVLSPLNHLRSTSASSSVRVSGTILDWKVLREMQPSEWLYLDAVVDGARGGRCFLLKALSFIVCYGTTVASSMYWPMQAALMTIEVQERTLGPGTKLWDIINFIRENRIRLMATETAKGLDCVNVTDNAFGGHGNLNCQSRKTAHKRKEKCII